MLNGGPPPLVYAWRDQRPDPGCTAVIYKFQIWCGILNVNVLFLNIRHTVPQQSDIREFDARSHSSNLFDVKTFRLPQDEMPQPGQRKDQCHLPEGEGYLSSRPKGAPRVHVEDGLTRPLDSGEGKIKSYDYPKVSPPFRPWMTAAVIGGDPRILTTLIGISN